MNTPDVYIRDAAVDALVTAGGSATLAQVRAAMPSDTRPRSVEELRAVLVAAGCRVDPPGSYDPEYPETAVAATRERTTTVRAAVAGHHVGDLASIPGNYPGIVRFAGMRDGWAIFDSINSGDQVTIPQGSLTPIDWL